MKKPLNETTLILLLFFTMAAMANFMDVKPIEDELTFVSQVVPYSENFKGAFNQAHQMSQGCGSHSQFHGAQFGPPALVGGLGRCSWAQLERELKEWCGSPWLLQFTTPR